MASSLRFSCFKMVEVGSPEIWGPICQITLPQPQRTAMFAFFFFPFKYLTRSLKFPFQKDSLSLWFSGRNVMIDQALNTVGELTV